MMEGYLEMHEYAVPRLKLASSPEWKVLRLSAGFEPGLPERTPLAFLCEVGGLLA